MKRHHGEGKLLIKVARLQLKGLVHYHHGREHGSMKADMVLEKELLHVDMHAIGSKLTHWE